MIIPRTDEQTPFAVQILVIEDNGPFRRYVCATLREKPGLQIVGEAADGLEGLHKAETLQPDMIQLDIGLPGPNGFETARRIRKVAPNSRILFLSQETSASIVQAALGLGAWGYITKANVGTELLAAMDAVLQDKRFVSARLRIDPSQSGG